MPLLNSTETPDPQPQAGGVVKADFETPSQLALSLLPCTSMPQAPVTWGT